MLHLRSTSTINLNSVDNPPVNAFKELFEAQNLCEKKPKLKDIEGPRFTGMCSQSGEIFLHFSDFEKGGTMKLNTGL